MAGLTVNTIQGISVYNKYLLPGRVALVVSTKEKHIAQSMKNDCMKCTYSENTREFAEKPNKKRIIPENKKPPTARLSKAKTGKEKTSKPGRTGKPGWVGGPGWIRTNDLTVISRAL